MVDWTLHGQRPCPFNFGVPLRYARRTIVTSSIVTPDFFSRPMWSTKATEQIRHAFRPLPVAIHAWLTVVMSAIKL